MIAPNAMAPPAACWRQALARGLQRTQTAASPSPTIVTRTLPGNLGKLHLGAGEPLTQRTPGNGGLRLWRYKTSEAAIDEAQRLGMGMGVKHDVFNTGFAGAKLVCAAEDDPSTWSAADKQVLLDEVGDMLAEQGGAMYTGCDMNTTVDDMAYLAERSPFVLAAIGNSACCPNTATAYGVFGGVEATLGGDVKGKSLLVHGCGNVGATVARLLVEHGAASVRTIDMASSRAEIAGCVNVSESHKESWWAGNYDAIVPCSSSGLFTAQIAAELRCGAIVGATNLPFATRADQEVAEIERGVKFVPEGVSSAGAVIVDSIEHFRPQAFAAAEPEAMYEFTREVVREKVAALVLLAERLNVPPSLATPLITADRSETPIGMRFGSDCDGAAEAAAEAAAAASIAAVGRLEAAIPEAARPAVASHFDQIHSHVNLLQQHFAGGKSGSVDSRRAARALSTTSQRFGGGKRSFSTGVGRRRGLATPSAPAPAADVVIVGGGIMGLNIAYQLRRRDANLSITVLERAPAVGHGSSGYSTGFQRAYYSFDETMAFALDGETGRHCDHRHHRLHHCHLHSPPPRHQHTPTPPPPPSPPPAPLSCSPRSSSLCYRHGGVQGLEVVPAGREGGGVLHRDRRPLDARVRAPAPPRLPTPSPLTPPALLRSPQVRRGAERGDADAAPAVWGRLRPDRRARARVPLPAHLARAVPHLRRRGQRGGDEPRRLLGRVRARLRPPRLEYLPHRPALRVPPRRHRRPVQPARRVLRDVGRRRALRRRADGGRHRRRRGERRQLVGPVVQQAERDGRRQAVDRGAADADPGGAQVRRRRVLQPAVRRRRLGPQRDLLYAARRQQPTRLRLGAILGRASNTPRPTHATQPRVSHPAAPSTPQVAHRFESEIVDPDAYNDSLDPDVKQDYLNCLFHRLPGLPRDGEIIGFSHMYTVNQDDVHPMIGETAVGGLWACNGFSGHGFKLAPAVGSLVAQQITGLKTDAWETSIAHDFMGPYREPLTLKVKTHFA